MTQVKIILQWRREASVVAWIAAVLLCNSGAGEARATNSSASPSYSLVCPHEFLLLGSSCYYFSSERATWQDAHFDCLDHKSNLTAPKRWEDRNVREYLNRPQIDAAERWIGGAYDWEARVWKWAGEARKMGYQSFSRMPRLDHDQLKWQCIAMDPQRLYRWTPRSCLESHLYICQTNPRKIPLARVNMIEQDYRHSASGNEQNSIVASHSRNENSAKMEQRKGPYAVPRAAGIERNVIPRPLRNDPEDRNEFANRPPPEVKRKPFPGYRNGRRDPEAAYKHNVRLLKSGTTGLSEQQVERHLRRLERIRNARLGRNKRLNRRRDDDEWLTNSIPRSERRGHRGHRARGMERVTHRTYLVDNDISPLHPKTIVEVHELSLDS